MTRFFVLILFFLFSGMTAAACTEHVAVVCPQRFYGAIETWIKYRSSQGYTVHVLSESPEPERIKEKIRLLAEQVPLSAVLLVGKADIPSPQIPCRVIQHFGDEKYLASDDWYADLNGNGLADIAVGRWAISTVTELETQIRKTIRYETEMPVGDWSRRLQIVAGLSNFSPLLDGVIESAVRYALTETVPESFSVSLLHADWKSSFCPAPVDYPAELVETLNRAPLFWAYFGHGHPKMLDPLSTPLGYLLTLAVEKFPQLHCRESFSIALLFCCYGGVLDTADRSIAENMVIQPEGPVAVLAASRTTMPYGMSVFGIEFFQEYLRCQSASESGVPVTLGSLVLKAKQLTLQPSTPQSTEAGQKRSIRQNLEAMAKTFDPLPKQLNDQLTDHVAMFHLFGDPLLRVPVPKPIRLTCPTKVKPGEMLRIEGSLNNLFEKAAGTVSVELVLPASRISTVSPLREEFRIDAETRKSNNEEYLASNNRTVLRLDVPLSDGSFFCDFLIPPTARGDYAVRAFYAVKNVYAIGCAKISVGR